MLFGQLLISVLFAAFRLFVSFAFVPSVLHLFHCSLTSRKMKIIPQERCMVLTSKFVSLYREPARNSLLSIISFCKHKATQLRPKKAGKKLGVCYSVEVSVVYRMLMLKTLHS